MLCMRGNEVGGARILLTLWGFFLPLCIGRSEPAEDLARQTK